MVEALVQWATANPLLAGGGIAILLLWREYWPTRVKLKQELQDLETKIDSRKDEQITYLANERNLWKAWAIICEQRLVENRIPVPEGRP